MWKAVTKNTTYSGAIMLAFVPIQLSLYENVPLVMVSGGTISNKLICTKLKDV